jgi:hypothetical protein
MDLFQPVELLSTARIHTFSPAGGEMIVNTNNKKISFLLLD